MQNNTRRYDIDWLRVIAIWLLIIYHLGLGFQAYGVFVGFIQNNEHWPSLQVPMSILNLWRIPLLFFISGMGVSFAIRKRNWGELMKERAQRILLPLVFGSLAIVPLHVMLWQDYYLQDLNYSPFPGHLWFLGNIFFYVLVLSPLFIYLKQRVDQSLGQRIQRFFGHPIVFLVIVIPFVIEAQIIQPEFFEMYAFTRHGFWLGLIAFLVGFLMVYAGEPFLQQLKRYKWLFLGAGLTLFAVRWAYFDLSSPLAMKAVESNLFVFAVLGLGFEYLNRPSKRLSYLSTASYPIYILHMLFLYAGSYVVFPLYWPVALKFIVVFVFTFVGCYATYEYLIRRVRILRPLFGLKLEQRQSSESTPQREIVDTGRGEELRGV
ncbi:MAG: acyltransferase [Bacteroidota bacterium]